jgi:hypothetical protein
MEDNNEVSNGVRNLLRTLLVGNVSNGIFDEENEQLQEFLRESAYLTSADLQDMGDNLYGGVTRRNRSRIRYLAALMPEKNLHELATAIHYVMNNQHISVTDVRDIVRGKNRDLPFEKIQQVGKLLAEGYSLRLTSRTVGVSFDSVERIETFIGISETYRLKLVDFACDAVRSGWSIRQFAAKANIPKSTAHVVMKKAKSVLIEIGELSA